MKAANEALIDPTLPTHLSPSMIPLEKPNDSAGLYLGPDNFRHTLVATSNTIGKNMKTSITLPPKKAVHSNYTLGESFYFVLSEDVKSRLQELPRAAPVNLSDMFSPGLWRVLSSESPPLS